MTRPVRNAKGQFAKRKTTRRNPPPTKVHTYRGVEIVKIVGGYLVRLGGDAATPTTLTGAKRYVDAVLARRGTRRNPSHKSGPSHDLFGERSHQTGLFGGKVYEAKPKPKKTAAEKKRDAKHNAGQTSFDIGFTRSLFG